jgi:5'-3' exoribonuclease 2
MCFLLGNDFLPHFPAMNIRTHGIGVLMEIYKNLLGSHSDRFFVSQDKKIQWRHVSSFVNEIAKNEHQYLINEYFLRDKWDKRLFPESTPKERDDLLSNVPVLYRSEEKYISPNEYGWEKRYYNILLGESDTKMIAMNYIEGLEWVLKYYTQGCPDWKWKYQYDYPPLFSDLKIYVPHFEMDFIKPSKNNHSFSPQLQLAYVLPKSQLHLLPKKIKDFLLKNYGEYYPVEYQMQWAFCRYFWESHPQLPEIPLNLLEQWDTQFRLSMTA